jgi:hypothetical protein
MSPEQQVKALQAVLEHGKHYTLPEILDVVKTITGNDKLINNTLESLYKDGVILAHYGNKPEEAIRIDFYTHPDIPDDGLPIDITKVKIRKVEIV